MRQPSESACKPGTTIGDKTASESSCRYGGRGDRRPTNFSRAGERSKTAQRDQRDGKAWDRNRPCSDKERCATIRHGTRRIERDDVSVMQDFRSLRNACLSSVDTSSSIAGVDDASLSAQNRKAMAQFVSQYCHILPAEETATGVVRDIFLPSLYTPTNDIADVFQAIRHLLLNDKHASALMAHLTEMVEETGDELAVENPIRAQLFHVLPALLPMSASCLTTALRVARHVDGNSAPRSTGNLCRGRVSAGTNGGISSFDVRAVKSYLRNELDGTRDHDASIALDLLLAVLQVVPSSAQSLANDLLWKDASVRPVSPALSASTCRCGFRCHDGSTPSFLEILHSTADQAMASVAMNCATELITLLPLHQWLQTGRLNVSAPCGSRKRQESVPSLSLFQSGVARSIETMVQIAICRCSEYENTASISLVKAILTQVPYAVDEHGCLRNECSYGELSVKLVENLAVSTSTCSLARKLCMDCLGGHITPNGRLTECSVPVATWLSSSCGIAFLEDLISHQPLKPSTETEKSSLLLFQAILRGCPRVVQARRSTWVCVQNFISTALQNDAVVASHTMERFLQGRFDFLRDTTSPREVSDCELLEFAALTLPSFVSFKQDETVLRFGCECYSFLQSADWSWGSFSASSHIERILSLCSDGNAVSVRTTACKAIGNVCANFYAAGGDGAAMDNVLFSAIVRTLIQAMGINQPSSVQCMALFAVGNLVQAILPRSLHLSSSHYQLVCSAAELSLSLMASTNEKVSANAVRTCGWLACWIFRNHGSGSSECSFSAITYLDRVVNQLTMHVHSALTLCTREVRLLTWKQRSGIKRQGWGACNALAILFQNHFTDDTTTDGKIRHIYEGATACLLQCIVDLTVLHEKVAASALTALLKLNEPTFASMTTRNKDTGKALVSCCDFLFCETTHSCQNTSLQRQVTMLLTRLMSCVSICHLERAFESSSFASHLSQLYEWMAQHDCPTESFQCVAEALCSNRTVAPLVQEKFANRGAHAPYHQATSSLDDEL